MTTNLSWPPVFGFESVKHPIDQKDKYFDQRNKSKIMGYVPLLGIYTAIRKSIVLSQLDDTCPTSLKVRLIVRIVLEALGLGLLFLIPDLFLTAVRHIRANCTPTEKEPATIKT